MGFLDHIAESGIRTVYSYWLAKRRGSMVPRKRNIDPAELPPQLLPWMFIYRRELDERYRCILSGTGIALLDGQDATNHYLHELEPAAAAESLGLLFTQTLDEGLPLYFGSRHAGSGNRDNCLARLLPRNQALGGEIPGRTEQGCSTLLLPISGNRQFNNHILGIAMVREALPTDHGEGHIRPGGDSVVLSATPEDLRRREPATIVA